MSADPTLAVVLVNWNNEDDTAECLDSLETQTYDDFVTVVVDNGSDRSSYEYLRENYEWPVYVRNERNLGFTGGNNAGIREALNRGVDWVFLLNNDTVLREGFLEDLVAAAESLPSTAGVVGPRVHTYEEDELWSAGGDVNPFTGTTRHRTGDERQYGSAEPVDYVVGAALLLRRETIDDVGMLDDEFFIYYEETELCRRTAGAGWGVWYVPVSGVRHKEGLDFEHSPFRAYYLTRNRTLFVRKTQPAVTRAVFYLVYVARWVVAQAAYLVVVERDAAAARETVRGAAHALVGRTGKSDRW